jgi:hypothetical protein
VHRLTDWLVALDRQSPCAERTEAAGYAKAGAKVIMLPCPLAARVIKYCIN